jgi:hypothetical protein
VRLKFGRSIVTAAFLPVAAMTAFAAGGTMVGTKVGTAVGTKIGTSAGSVAAASAAPASGGFRPATRGNCDNEAFRPNAPITGPGSAPNPNLIPTIPYGVGTTYGTLDYPSLTGTRPARGC